MRRAATPLGEWRYDRSTGLNVLDTESERAAWRPLFVSIAVTTDCPQQCAHCYLAQSRGQGTAWTYEALLSFIYDLDQHGVFAIALGGGEPTVWSDPKAGKTFYDLLAEVTRSVRLGLTFTTGGVPELDLDRLVDVPVRISCHRPENLDAVLVRAKRLRERLSSVGINFLLWRSKIDQCRDCIYRLLDSGFDDILLHTLHGEHAQSTFSDDCMPQTEVQSFLSSLNVERLHLSACQDPGRMFSNDMGCGAGDWFVSVTAFQQAKPCSFSPTGTRLSSLTYEALQRATMLVERPVCYRALVDSSMGRFMPDWKGV